MMGQVGPGVSHLHSAWHVAEGEQSVLMFCMFEIFWLNEPMSDMLKVEIIVLVSEMPLGIWSHCSIISFPVM